MRACLTLLLISVFLITPPLFGYVIYLKDGSRLMARERYEIDGDKALIVLQNGTRTSIAAAEIDRERTREANAGGYGSALVLEEGKLTELPAETQPEPKGSLSEAVGERRRSAATRPPARRPVATATEPDRLSSGALDLRVLARTPASDSELVAEVQRVFRAQGHELVSIFQGSASDRLLVDITTNSEVAVFRGLEAAASALLHARDLRPAASTVFELLMHTAEDQQAGQFVLTAPLAERLAGGELDPSTFFIEHVRF